MFKFGDLLTREGRYSAGEDVTRREDNKDSWPVHLMTRVRLMAGKNIVYDPLDMTYLCIRLGEELLCQTMVAAMGYSAPPLGQAGAQIFSGR